LKLPRLGLAQRREEIRDEHAACLSSAARYRRNRARDRPTRRGHTEGEPATSVVAERVEPTQIVSCDVCGVRFQLSARNVREW
jgi:hypothetical protein